MSRGRKIRRPKRTDVAAKVVVIVIARTPQNAYIKGNVMRSWSVAGARVSDVAKAIEPAIRKLQRRRMA